MGTVSNLEGYRVSRMAFALAPAGGMIIGWDEGRPLPLGDPAGRTGPPPTPEQAVALLRVLRRTVEPAMLGRFAAAVQAGDPAAVETLADVAECARMMVPGLRDALQRDFGDGSYAEVVETGTVVADLAGAVDLDDVAAAAVLLAARSAFALGDLDTTIALYEGALAGRDVAVDLRCTFHDNLGLALARRGGGDDLDRAVEHYDRAIRCARSTDEIVGIRNNRMFALQELGLFRAVAAEGAEIHALLLQIGAPDRLRAVVLDNWAGALLALGDFEGALANLTEAAALFPPDAAADRMVNALQRSETLLAAGRRDDAGRAFVDADAFAERAVRSRLDVPHLRDGYRSALRRRVAPDHEAWEWFNRGMDAYRAGGWGQAQHALRRAADAAGNAGDRMLELRCWANYAALLADADQVAQAVDICRQVRDVALRTGLAGIAAMVIGTRMSLHQQGAGTSGEPPLLLAHWSRALHRVHAELVTEARLPDDDPERRLLIEYGTLDNQLARLADRHGATELAVRHYRTAIAAARNIGHRVGELNRSVGLLEALSEQGRSARPEADALAAQLEGRLAEDGNLEQTRFVVARGLAGYYGPADPRHLPHLRTAAAAVERMRAQLPPGAARAEVDRGYQVTPMLVNALHKTGAPASEIFDALQVTRARGLLETLAAAAGTEFRPPSTADVRRHLVALGDRQALLDLTRVEGGLLALLLEPHRERTLFVRGDLHALGTALWGDALTRAAEVVESILGSAVLGDLAAAVEDALDPGVRLLVVVDDVLANLPLHLVPVGGRSWGDVRVMGRLSAAAQLAHTPADRGWLNRSLVAGDSAGDLSGAARECADVGALLEVGPLVAGDCTVDRIGERLDERLDVVHLAVHGRADIRDGGRSSLLLGAADGATAWVPFARLAALPWRAQVIVFSGCSTAVGGPRNGLGLYGVAQAAAQAGATTVVASLWPTEDEAARVLMTAFHAALRRRRDRGDTVADLRELLAEARREAIAPTGVPATAHRGGRDLGFGTASDEASAQDDEVRHHLRWGAFVILGDPTVSMVATAGRTGRGDVEPAAQPCQ